MAVIVQFIQLKRDIVAMTFILHGLNIETVF